MNTVSSHAKLPLGAVFAPVLICGLLQGCGPTVITPPVPAARAVPPPAYADATSDLLVHAHLSAATLQQALIAAIPNRIDYDNDEELTRLWTHDHLAIHLVVSNKRVALQEGKALVTAHVAGRVTASGHVAVLGDKKADIDVAGEVRLEAASRLAPDWKIVSSVSSDIDVRKADWDVGPFTIHLRDKLRHGLDDKKPAFERDIAAQISQHLDFRRAVETLWRSAYTTRQLGGPVPGQLVNRPVSVSAAPMSISPNGVDCTLALSTKLAFAFDTSAHTNRPDALPQLILVPRLGGRTRIDLPVFLPLTNQMLFSAGGKVAPITVPLEGERTLAIDAIAATGFGSEMLVTVTARIQKADRVLAAGRLFLTGKPVYHHETKRFGFDALDFTAETRSAWARYAAWMFHDRLRAELVAKSRFDVALLEADALREARAAMAAYAASLGGRARLTVDEIELVDVSLAGTSLYALCRATGGVALEF